MNDQEKANPDACPSASAQAPKASADTEVTNLKANFSRSDLLYLLPVVGWVGISTYWLWHLLPWWAAVPLGIVLGFILMFVTAQVIGGGATTLMEITIGSTIALICALILTPTRHPPAPAPAIKARQATCLSNMRKINIALLQYSVDYDNKMPPALHWADAALPYLQKRTADERGVNVKNLFQCPEDKADFSYAFDSRLSGKVIDNILEPKTTMLIYESTAGRRNANDNGTSLPKPGRHLSGNNIGYLDGHARWLPDGKTPEQQAVEIEAKQDD